MKPLFLEKISISKQIRPADFLKYPPAPQKKKLVRQAAYMRGKRVVHINATAEGGGVAEILQSLITYLRALGIEGDWYVINPKIGNSFFSVTNKIHDAMQGAAVKITGKEWKEYERTSKLIAGELDKIDCDVLVINDPQPLLAGCRSHLNKHKIYFSHIDTSAVFGPVWKKLFPCIASYRRIVFSNRDFVNGDLPRRKVKIFTPAIDPLSPKQKIVALNEARLYLKKHGGIPVDCPLIVQVSRFDIWKNPLGVIQAFRIVQQTHPEARLALVGFNTANDNPASSTIYKDIAAVAGRSRDIFLFFNAKGKDVLKFTVMAQNAADVIIQNSIKEGFGLVVTEAMWKRKPVIGGTASGIRKQIRDGKNGFVAKTPEDLAEKIVFLLSHPEKRKMLGEYARKTVLKKFLFPRLVLDHLKLYQSCLK
ncbi:MAG: glycosyltransferase [Candidatus Giovannonibacteria bacterium]|nr:MAG: glycosyltransferase [Candidatus Giovannonibacteria bacterium]